MKRELEGIDDFESRARFVPNASIYDPQPIVLLDQFPWAERESVLQALG